MTTWKYIGTGCGGGWICCNFQTITVSLMYIKVYVFGMEMSQRIRFWYQILLKMCVLLFGCVCGCVCVCVFLFVFVFCLFCLFVCFFVYFVCLLVGWLFVCLLLLFFFLRKWKKITFSPFWYKKIFVTS